MIGWPKLFVVVLGMVVLSGCTAERWKARFDSQGPAEGEPALTAFGEDLRVDYLDHALADMTNWPNAATYAKKAALSKKALTTWPDHPDRFRLPVGAMLPVEEYFRRMTRTLYYGAGDIVPTEAALMQTSWDCWVRDIQHYKGMEPMTSCGLQFVASLQAVEAADEQHMIQLCAVPPAPAPARQMAAAAPARTPQPEPLARSFLIFFDWDKDDITPEAAGIIQAAADYAKSGGFARIQLTGHADRSGPADYNMDLSRRRAESARRQFVADGITADQIGLDWKGEADPLVPTADGVREPQNRRVEIEFPGS